MASRQSGLDPCPGPILETLLQQAGFTDIKAEKHVWPVGTWPADKHLVRAKKKKKKTFNRDNGITY